MANGKWRPIPDIQKFFETVHSFGVSPLGDLAADIYEEHNNVIVELHIPGIEQDKIDISIHEQMLKISATRQEIQETKERGYYRKEIERGDFERVIPLPTDVDTQKVTAEANNGVLLITLPKKSPTQSQKIKIGKK